MKMRTMIAAATMLAMATTGSAQTTTPQTAPPQTSQPQAQPDPAAIIGGLLALLGTATAIKQIQDDKDKKKDKKGQSGSSAWREIYQRGYRDGYQGAPLDKKRADKHKSYADGYASGRADAKRDRPAAPAVPKEARSVCANVAAHEFGVAAKDVRVKYARWRDDAHRFNVKAGKRAAVCDINRFGNLADFKRQG